MTTIGINNIKKFCSILDAISPISADVNMICQSDTVLVCALDQAKVCYVNLTLNSDGFEEYEAPEDGSVLGIGLKQLTSMMSVIAKETGSLVLKTDESGDKLTIQGNGEDKKAKRKGNFVLNLKTLANLATEMPEEEYTSAISLQSTQFREFVQDLAPIGNYCKFIHEGQTLTFSVRGDSGEGSLACEVEDHVVDRLELNFAIKYMLQLLPLVSLSDTVQLYMCADKPLLIQLDLDLPGTACGDLRIYLAPRIDTD